MRIGEKIRKTIKEHSLKEKPRECCGLIVESKGVLSVHQSKNNSTDLHRFSVNPLDYISASKKGKIVAVYHSHMKGCEFSEFDKFNSKSHGLAYVLYCLENNSFLTYDPELEFNSYIGRPFKWGISDCFNLIKDFYGKELNIDITTDYPRGQDWKKKLGGVFDKYFEKENFKEVKNLKKYDGILFKTKNDGISNHCAIYLGGGLILHQPRNMVSRIDEYDSRYKNLTNKILRHKSL